MAFMGMFIVFLVVVFIIGGVLLLGGLVSLVAGLILYFRTDKKQLGLPMAVIGGSVLGLMLAVTGVLVVIVASANAATQ